MKGAPRRRIARFQQQEEALQLGIVPNETTNKRQVVLFPDSKVGVSLTIANDMIDQRLLDFLWQINRTLVIVSQHLLCSLKSQGRISRARPLRANQWYWKYTDQNR